MSDVNYTFEAALKKSYAYAQRRSVLWPLMGRRSLRNQDVQEDCKQLLAWWRAKISALYKAGWAGIPSILRLQYMRNCPPSMVFVKSQRACRPCTLTNFCPWCYSREVKALYDDIATWLPERGAIKNPLTIIEVSNSKLVRATKTVSAELDREIREWQRHPKHIVKSLNALGAYYGVSLEPSNVGHKRYWRLTYRVLAIVPTDFEMPAWLTRKETNRKVIQSVVRSKKQLVQIIGRTCRYPSNLLREKDDMRLILALNGRHNMKLRHRCGCLRRVKGVLNGSPNRRTQEGPTVA